MPYLEHRSAGGDRSLGDLAFHLFRSALAFADGMDLGRVPSEWLAQTRPPDLQDGDAVARYGALVRGRVAGWFEGAGPGEYARVIDLAGRASVGARAARADDHRSRPGPDRALRDGRRARDHPARAAAGRRPGGPATVARPKARERRGPLMMQSAAVACSERGRIGRAHHSEAVVGVAQRRRKGRAMGHGAPRITMAPRAAAGDPSSAVARAGRISVGRGRVVVRAVPVETPLVTDTRERGDAERVLGRVGDERRTLEGARGRSVLAPGKPRVRKSSARRLLPLRLGGKAMPRGGRRRQPVAVRDGLEPARADDGLCRLAEARVRPPRGRGAPVSSRNRAYSRLVTGKRAMAKASVQTRWRGRSPGRPSSQPIQNQPAPISTIARSMRPSIIRALFNPHGECT